MLHKNQISRFGKWKAFAAAAALLLTAAVFSCSDSVYQVSKEADKMKAQSLRTEVGDEAAFTVVDQGAAPKGGFKGLYAFIGENMKYPEDAKNEGVEGKVYVQFIVEKDGSLNDFKSLTDVDPRLAEAAIDVLKKVPNWEVARHDGKVVRQLIVMPINFTTGAPDEGLSIKEVEISKDEKPAKIEKPAVPAEGYAAFYKQLSENVEYPASAKESGTEGAVYVRLTIEKDGSVSDYSVLKSPNEELSGAAISALKKAGKWLPAEDKGEKVRQQLVLPVKFKL